MAPTADEPAGPAGDGGLVRVRLEVAYDGTSYAGWARQVGQLGVAEVVEGALATVLRLDPRGGPPRTTVAGRTDAGVHARRQVCHLDIPRTAWAAVVGRSNDPPERALVRRLAGVLPPEVSVRRAELAPPGFDARFSALSRRYAYRLTDDVAGVDPLRRHEVVHHPRPLDVAAMDSAARTLLGERDFAAFCRRRAGGSTIRTLLEFSWRRREDGLVVASVVADAFCHSMVRALVGVLLPVGDGRRGTDWPGAVLAARVRDPAVMVAPAHGLTLEEVAYPPDDELAERATLTRRRRTAP
jgi:tRNA pseudouridine38-40 synthase